MKTLRLLVVAALALAVIGAGVADGKTHKGKAAFTPKAGDYVGFALSAGTKKMATAKVAKAAGKTGLLITLPVTLSCSDGSSVADSLSFNVQVKNNSFSESVVGSDRNTYKLNGKFTGAKAMSGSASKEGPLSVQVADSPTCSTGKVSFSLTTK